MQHKCMIVLFNLNLYISLFQLTRSTELPELIYELCPYSDICNRTASRTINSKKLIPCCSSCSCDEDCGLHHNCCFDHLDKYRLVDRGMVACIVPEIRHEDVTKKIYIRKGYMMVQACLIDNLGMLKAGGNTTHCRRVDENGNSLIAPVSSVENNAIYINEECAACNQVDKTRTKQWDYLIQSNRVGKESIITGFRNNLETDFGIKTYIPPTEENWSHKSCYIRDVEEVTACHRNTVWKELCQNLHSIFYLGKEFYKNVFCLLCTGVLSDEILKECLPEYGKDIEMNLFTILLNSAVLKASVKLGTSSIIDKSGSESTCPTGHVHGFKSCLPIYCPEGMLRTPNGCKYFALMWYPSTMTMQVKLTPTEGTRLSYGTLKGKHPLSWLEIPCKQVGLTAVLVYYSTTDSTVEEETNLSNGTKQYITSLIVILYKYVDERKYINPSVLIPLFNKCVTENWKATLRNETYMFAAYFDKYIDYVQDGREILRKWPGREMDGNARPALYKSVVPYPTLRQYELPLKKLFFCEQVHVPIHDVDIRFGEILIISKNSSLGTNEYIVNLPEKEDQQTSNETTFSVCVDDYNPSFLKVSRGTNCIGSSSEMFIKTIFLTIFIAGSGPI